MSVNKINDLLIYTNILVEYYNPFVFNRREFSWLITSIKILDKLVSINPNEKNIKKAINFMNIYKNIFHFNIDYITLTGLFALTNENKTLFDELYKTYRNYINEIGCSFMFEYYTIYLKSDNDIKMKVKNILKRKFYSLGSLDPTKLDFLFFYSCDKWLLELDSLIMLVNKMRNKNKFTDVAFRFH